jgi:hypothetical protein
MSRWILGLGLVVMLPVPLFFIGPGLVPAAHLLLLGGIGLAVMLLENARGSVGILTAILLGQAALYVAVLWLLAALIVSFVGRVAPQKVGLITLVAVALGFILTSAFEVYHTRFAADSPHASLLEVYL